jgi:hypothetical protein
MTLELGTTRTGDAAATLHRLLDDDLQFSPSYRGSFSNHLAMALVGLAQLGAPADVLAATLAAHARHDPEYRDDRDVLERRIDEVRRDGIAATLHRRLPELVDAPATALFHPMIRLAYALDVGHEGQVAAALLDWERRRDVLPVAVVPGGRRRLPDVAAVLASAPPGTWPRTFDLHGIARRAVTRAALRGVAVDEHTIDDVSSFALAAHLAADDFVTLHLVTGARAARAVAAWLEPDEARRLATAMTAAMAVGYAAVGAPPLLGPAELTALRQLALPAPAEIASQAIADDDPHVIKLANVALVEGQRTGDRLYRFVAAHIVGLVPAARDAVAA